jgi:hypothetical protein
VCVEGVGVNSGLDSIHQDCLSLLKSVLMLLLVVVYLLTSTLGTANHGNNSLLAELSTL